MPVAQGGENVRVDLVLKAKKLGLGMTLEEPFIPGNPTQRIGKGWRDGDSIEIDLHPESLVVGDREGISRFLAVVAS